MDPGWHGSLRDGMPQSKPQQKGPKDKTEARHGLITAMKVISIQ